MQFTAARAHGLSLRLIAPADMPFLARVYASTREQELASTGWAPTLQAQFLQQQFEAQHLHYVSTYPAVEMLVINEHGIDAGRLTMNQTEAAIGLVDIAFLPHARGRGAGTAILTDIITHANDVQKPIILHVERHNPAMRLYLRHGFVTVEPGQVYDRMEWRPLMRR